VLDDDDDDDNNNNNQKPIPFCEDSSSLQLFGHYAEVKRK
jgi:hypothetical protein